MSELLQGINLAEPKKKSLSTTEKVILAASVFIGIASVVFVLIALSRRNVPPVDFTQATIVTSQIVSVSSTPTPSPTVVLISGYKEYADDFIKFLYPENSQVAVKKNTQTGSCDPDQKGTYYTKGVSSVIINSEAGLKFNLTLQPLCDEPNHSYLLYSTKDPRYFTVNNEKAKRLLTAVPFMSDIPSLGKQLFVYMEDGNMQHATLISKYHTDYQFSGSYENYSQINLEGDSLDNIFGNDPADAAGTLENAYYLTLVCPVTTQAQADSCAEIIDNFFKTLSQVNESS